LARRVRISSRNLVTVRVVVAICSRNVAMVYSGRAERGMKARSERPSCE
jgi:hypothetical protein